MDMGMAIGHLAPEIALVLGAVTCLMTAAFTSRAHQWTTSVVAVAAVIASAALSIRLAVGADQQLSFDRAWALDGITQGAELIIATVTLLTLLLSVEWFRTDPRRGEYPAIVLFSAAGAMLLAGAADTMEIVVGMLLVSVTGYTLAAYHRASPAAVEAGIKYFLVGALTNAVLLIGVVILYGSTGTTNLADIAAVLASDADRVALAAAVVCIGVGLAFEIGAVPAHVWLPDVAQGAPAPSAAFLTVVPKIGALVALGRVLHVLPDDVIGWRPLVAVLAAATMTLGNLAAIWQDDLRRLLGWSSVSQAGYALMAIVVIDRSAMALPALMFFLAGYAVANTAAFAVVTELRGRTALTDYRGLASSHPWLAATLVVALLSLVGIPPLAGFVGKLTLFTAAIDGGYAWLAALAVANTVVSLFYYLRVIGPLYFEPSPQPSPAPVLGQWSATAAGLTAVAVVAVGLAAEPLLAALSGAQLLP
jgi:NADH-quinone oxidoreductase subunit N